MKASRSRGPSRGQSRGASRQKQKTYGGAGSISNMGGYGTYDVDKPSSRVLRPPGGGSSFSLGGGDYDAPSQQGRRVCLLFSGCVIGVSELLRSTSNKRNLK